MLSSDSGFDSTSPIYNFWLTKVWKILFWDSPPPLLQDNWRAKINNYWNLLYLIIQHEWWNWILFLSLSLIEKKNGIWLLSIFIYGYMHDREIVGVNSRVSFLQILEWIKFYFLRYYNIRMSHGKYIFYLTSSVMSM